MSRRTAGLVAAALAAGAQAGAEDKVDFSSQVAPILNMRCVMCHVEGNELGALSLYPEPLTSLVGVASNQAPLKLVEPGSPEKSYLYAKLLGTQDSVGGSGLQMPPQQSPLDAAEIETIRRWITEGAGRD
jgi:hypothetical protein